LVKKTPGRGGEERNLNWGYWGGRGGGSNPPILRRRSEPNGLGKEEGANPGALIWAWGR